MTFAGEDRLGPYEILAPLGAGGMGEVYRAKDTRLDRVVAIKVLPEHLRNNPDLKARFEREARAISQLTHPHICTLYDVGHENGIDYLVMEYLEGQTLVDRLAKGPLPLDQVLKIGSEIASALDRAHRNGVVHRDLKPGNIDCDGDRDLADIPFFVVALIDPGSFVGCDILRADLNADVRLNGEDIAPFVTLLTSGPCP